MLYGLKGESYLIATLCNLVQRVELRRFHDGSWSISRDGFVVGCWEPADALECMRVFIEVGGLPDAIVCRRNKRDTADAHIDPSLN